MNGSFAASITPPGMPDCSRIRAGALVAHGGEIADDICAGGSQQKPVLNVGHDSCSRSPAGNRPN